MEDRIYCCIDLKSFYASVECVERGLDPFKANLVVADPDRGKGTVCLAVSPALKALGVKNRCRVFEIPNSIEYIIAKPRMKLYIDKSAEIYSIYLRYIAAEDIHVYSIDEVFIDITDYLVLYKKTAKTLARLLIDEVFAATGVRATVGIGTNLFLAKVALDITAKHADDFMGYLDVSAFKKTIWHHRPITDVWNVGRGIAVRLAKMGIFDLCGVAKCPEQVLYKQFGVNAELLIDHANGIEPCTIADIHAYRSKSVSLSNGQVLFSDYSFDDGLIVLKEMVEQLVLELVEKNLVTDSISLSVLFADRSAKSVGGTEKLSEYTSSVKKLIKYFTDYYTKKVPKTALIRKINVGLNDLIDEAFITRDLLTDSEKLDKERDLQRTVVGLKHKYGKNAILFGTSYNKRATGRDRNKLIGGHNGGEDDKT
ncbi:MAG: DNA repair protein [Clostridia bacterium]|nr:DNA repair protein [Clostridia bacterium]